MAKVTEVRCDRCNQSTHKKGHVLLLDGKRMDLCNPCYEPLRRWLGRDNATTQGDSGRPKSNRGPGWVEVCPHHVPCAGPCPDAHYARA